MAVTRKGRSSLCVILLLSVLELVSSQDVGPAKPPILLTSDKGSIQLKLEVPANANTCEVLMDNGRGSSVDQIVYSGDCLQNPLLSGLAYDKNYRFQMRGKSASNTYGPLSSMVSYVAAGVPQFAPQARPTVTKIGASDIKIRWPAPDGMGKYTFKISALTYQMAYAVSFISLTCYEQSRQFQQASLNLC